MITKYIRTGRVFTGKSLTYPVTYRHNFDEGIEFMPSLGFTEYDRISINSYDEFDFWFNNGWRIAKDNILMRIFIVFVLLVEISIIYILWRKIKLIIKY